ncbi:unnamed protein product [Ectocarpus sp. 6 AP-2014]
MNTWLGPADDKESKRRRKNWLKKRGRKLKKQHEQAASSTSATATAAAAAAAAAATAATAATAADSPIGKTTGGVPTPAHDARDAVRNLMASLDAAENRSGAIEVACQAFRETGFGKEVVHGLYSDGIVNIPYGESEESALSMAGVVCGAAQDLMLGEKPHKERIMIKGQTRYGLEARCMGGGTVAAFEKIASLLAAVLCAVVDGASVGVVTHKHVALANAVGTGVQMWHRDGRAKEVLAKTDPSHKGKRTRPEPHPFSAVIAFQENTVLHVVKGSHNRGEENDFSQDAPHTHHIPIGYTAVFYSILVHRGMGTDGDSPSENVRGHMYLTVAGCTLPPFGEIEANINGPEAVGTATSSTLAPAATTIASATFSTPVAVATPPLDDTAATAADVAQA